MSGSQLVILCKTSWQLSSRHCFIYLFIKNVLIWFWLHWVFVTACRLSLVMVWGLLIAVVYPVVEHGLWGMWAQWLWCTGLVALSMWDLPRPGIEPMSSVRLTVSTRSLQYKRQNQALSLSLTDTNTVYLCYSVQFSSVQSLSCVRLFVTPWTAARQASLSITNSQSLLRLMSIESVMPSDHLILCCPFSVVLHNFPSSSLSCISLYSPE